MFYGHFQRLPDGYIQHVLKNVAYCENMQLER